MADELSASSLCTPPAGVLQPTLAQQLQRPPWKDVPVLDRSTARGHGREEVREVQVVSVNGLLFPHAKQVVRICRRRRHLGMKKWNSETVFTVTDLATHQASAWERVARARGHWIIENSVLWIRDVTFGEDASRVCTRSAPTVMASLRDIVRGAFRISGCNNTASGRRTHIAPADTLTLHGIPCTRSSCRGKRLATVCDRIANAGSGTCRIHADNLSVGSSTPTP